MLAAIGDQPVVDFQQRQVRLAAIEAEQVIPMELDPLGPAVPAHRRRRNLTLVLEARHPAHRAGDADAKTLGRRIARHARVDHSLDNPFAKIVGKRHPPPPPLRGGEHESELHRFGNPQSIHSGWIPL